MSNPVVRNGSCATCYYSLKEGNDQYMCRRFPPTVNATLTPKGIMLSVHFPAMQGLGWCGEYKPDTEVMQ